MRLQINLDILRFLRRSIMDNYSLHNFYNNNRKPMQPTTLHNGNIDKVLYEKITYVRRMMCKESMPGKHDYKFETKDSNKENKYV
ncbi:hypothetical protein [Palpita vitrealis nucleopolyhedrovirus]|uniref:Uncharacterized protein n=1 Tax=Palpita vitrealis nucleopolyhedrovirus TaxID=2951960 RepID=A0AAE9RYX7_9ABAC|nr:hypothetical protein [Palpita vitrealis nucleopolyhedrovirus]